MSSVYYSPQSGFANNIDSFQGKAVDIALDSRCVSTHRLILPKLTNHKAKQAIPFALEDQLLSDVDSLEFISFKSAADGDWQVLVCAKQLLTDIIAEAKEHKIRLNKIYPDFLQLPEPTNAVVYINKHDGVLFRSAHFEGGWLPTSLFHDSFPDAQLASLNTSKSSANFIANMNQTALTKWLQPWLGAALLATLLALVTTAQLWSDNQALAKQIHSLKQSNEATFKQLFPNSKRIVNISVQAEQNLQQLRQQNAIHQQDFLSVLADSKPPSEPITQIIFENGKLSGSGQ